MSVDLKIITGHNLNFEEIIKLQEKIESDILLESLFWYNKNNAIDNWSTIVDCNRLNAAWIHNENQEENEGIFFYDTIFFPTFFGDLQFHKHIIVLSGFSLKLWTMENDHELRRNIIRFYERLAIILGQKNIIYYGDSYAKSSWIDELIYTKTIEEIMFELENRNTGKIINIGNSISEENLYIQRI